MSNLEHSTLSIGSNYPLDLLGLPTESEKIRLVCAVSLSCGHCLRLMPELKMFNESSHFEFLLITNGSEEDNEVVREQLGYNFHLISFADRPFVDIGIGGTPQTYFIDTRGKVISYKAIRQVNDLLDLWREGDEIARSRSLS